MPRGGIEVAEYIQTLTTLGYDFRLNEAGDVLECNGRRLDNVTLSTVRARMRAEGYGSAQAIEDVIAMQAGLNRYHPIRNYLAMAGMGWDGEPYIAMLAHYFHDATDPHKLFSMWLRKWLIGAVAKATDGEHNQNAMLVMDGPQGIGKSYFAQWLCSPLPEYFIEGAIDPREKDCKFRLASGFVWEVSELGSTTRYADVEALKAFISCRVVRERKPYAKMDSIMPALASLIGTVNNDAGFLSDQTGNRRFLIATIDAIDWSYATDIDPNQVWGEAFAAYQRGEDWYPTAEELKLSEANNDNFKIPDVIEGYIDRAFETDSNALEWWTPSNEIVSTLQSMGYRGGSSRSIAMQVASTLKALGHTKKRQWQTLENFGGNQRSVHGYVGVRPRQLKEKKTT